MKPNVYLYILVMAGVTYLIRMLPLVLFKREITSPFVKSFLYYVPYACLAAMTFPAILTATAGGIISGADNIRNCTIWIIFCKNICHSRFGDLRTPTKNSFVGVLRSPKRE